MLEALSESRVYVVVGMHRSGTRVVADILASLGIFMGADRQGDSESITFIELNEAIFHQCGTFWTEPLPVHVALGDPAHADEIAAAVRRELGRRLGRYLGAAGESWRERGGRIERELLDIDLFEISTVARPAYPATSVSARSAVLLTAGQARRNAMRRRMMLTRLRAA